MSKQEDQYGLEVYDGKHEDYIAKLSKVKAIKDAVRESASTDPENLERGRQEVGAVFELARKNISAINALMKERASEQVSKSRRTEIDETVKNLVMQNELMVKFGTMHATILVFDALTYRDQEETEVGDDKTKKKVWKYTRASIADIISRTLDDDESAYQFVEKSEFVGLTGLLLDMVYDIGKAVEGHINRNGGKINIFSGTITDANGVAIEVPDRIKYAREMQSKAEADQKAEAEAADKARKTAGITAEEAEKIKSSGFDELFGDK